MSDDISPDDKKKLTEQMCDAWDKFETNFERYKKAEGRVETRRYGGLWLEGRDSAVQIARELNKELRALEQAGGAHTQEVEAKLAAGKISREDEEYWMRHSESAYSLAEAMRVVKKLCTPFVS